MTNSRSGFNAALLALGLALAGGAQAAHATCPTAGLPPQVTCGTRDPSAATAGTYAIDPNHAAVIARVSHLDYSRSVFRFDRVKGILAWNPAAPAKSNLSVTVETASIDTNVAGFATELAGEGFLKSKAFPEATFVSTAFRRTSPTHGEVDGDLTLLGKTRRITFKVDLVGAGKGFGHPRMGIHAETRITPVDFGLTPLLADPIELVIDVEFEKTA